MAEMPASLNSSAVPNELVSSNPVFDFGIAQRLDARAGQRNDRPRIGRKQILGPRAAGKRQRKAAICQQIERRQCHARVSQVIRQANDQRLHDRRGPDSDASHRGASHTLSAAVEEVIAQQNSGTRHHDEFVPAATAVARRSEPAPTVRHGARPSKGAGVCVAGDGGRCSDRSDSGEADRRADRPRTARTRFEQRHVAAARVCRAVHRAWVCELCELVSAEPHLAVGPDEPAHDDVRSHAALAGRDVRADAVERRDLEVRQ